MGIAFAPKLSQVLMTPEPHYLPGYGGYCPSYKFTLGQTYGKLTSQLLTGPNRPGRRLLLQPTCCPRDWKEQLGKKIQGPGMILPGCRSSIPGYTGFIPRAQNHFAKPYSEICKQAWHELDQQRDAASRRQAWKATGAVPRLEDSRLEVAPLRATPETPLATAVAAATPDMSCCTFRPQGLPHLPRSSSPQAAFISGFTGYVPHAQFPIGSSCPVLTHQAKMLHRAERDSSNSGETLPPLAKMYPTSRGLLPHYQGHVPGYKFQFGHTYGYLTHNALGQSTLEKQALEVLQ